MATAQPFSQAPTLPQNRPPMFVRFGASATVPMPAVIYYPLLATLLMFIAANAAASTFTTVVNATKWLPLIALLALSATVILSRRAPRCPPIVLLPLLLLLVVSASGSFLGIQPIRGTMALISVATAMAAGYTVAAALVATDSRRAFFDLIAIIGRVMTIILAFFYVARINLGRGNDGFSAWADNPNMLAAMLAPPMVVFMAGCIERRPGWKVWHLAFLLLSLPIMWLTNGRASFVWLVFSACAFLLYRRGSWIMALPAMLALIILIGWWEPIRASIAHFLLLDVSAAQTTDAGPLSGRQEVWRIGWELFQLRPTFGYGIGSSQALIKAEAWRFVRFQGGHFHSSYLMSLVETGVIGFILLMVPLAATVVRGIGDAQRTRVLPREAWPTAALPFALVVGALGHAVFESWLIAAGNVNSPLFWICVWLIHLQTQVPVRGVIRGRAPGGRADPGTAPLPVR